jgi:uncharacterized protein YdhG (YjbR/CyaY superfamily)
MGAQKPKAADIDAYIAAFPPSIRARLRKMRAAIRHAAPNASEFEHHIGFYPGASGVKKFARKLGSYDFAKGSVQFPHDRPLPLALVAEIVEFRLAENLARYAPKTDAKPRSARRVAGRKTRAT